MPRSSHVGDRRARARRALARTTRRRPVGPLNGLALLAVRVAAGATFIGFSLGKFVRHGAETASFERYGVPLPELSTYAVGTVELVGGALLILGWLTRPAAAALGLVLIGAIGTAGVQDGGPVNLVLAPTLLASMTVIAWQGAGRLALDTA